MCQISQSIPVTSIRLFYLCFCTISFTSSCCELQILRLACQRCSKHLWLNSLICHPKYCDGDTRKMDRVTYVSQFTYILQRCITVHMPSPCVHQSPHALSMCALQFTCLLHVCITVHMISSCVCHSLCAFSRYDTLGIHLYSMDFFSHQILVTFYPYYIM